MMPLKFVLAFAALLPLTARAIVFGGAVRSEDAQPIFTPPSNSSPVVLRYYVPDGTRVKPGDVLVRIDAGQSAAEIRTLDGQIEQAKAKIAKETAELNLKAIDAELDAIDALAALDTAKVDAAIPRNLLSALDYDRYQAEFARAAKDAAFKQQVMIDARQAASRRGDDGKLELEKLRVQRLFDEAQVNAAEVRAERAGTIVHGFSNYFGANGGRVEEGSSSYPGQQIGEVVGSGLMRVRAWILEPDRAALRTGQALRLGFDALPGRTVSGTIEAISGASEAKAEWGTGYYFVVDISISDAERGDLSFKPGMSVRVETNESGDAARLVAANAQRTNKDVVQASGEVYAQTTASISPPAIEDLWELAITQMAGDGQIVKKGDLLVTFEGAEIQKQLTAKQSELQEKLRTQEKLRLELAEKLRTESVATAQAHADATKAERKASQPETVVPGVEYKKLIIARAKAEQRDIASVTREKAAAAERVAEQQLADADVAQLKIDVARMQAGLTQLSITAQREGIFLHSSTWRGEKVDVGTQVWRGMAVGEIPDMKTLAVRATLDERDVSRVSVGDAVRVMLEGGSGRSFPGRIEDIGLSVHSKSRVEPVPVVDLRIAIDAAANSLKPGQPVRVEITGAKKGTQS
jgi:multidrug resistance efflux pump